MKEMTSNALWILEFSDAMLRKYVLVYMLAIKLLECYIS